MKQPSSTAKLRGGYYTPPAIARFLARWAVGSGGRTFLEPSSGDGNILVEVVAALNRRRGASVAAVELDADEAAKSLRRAKAIGSAVHSEVRCADFFTQAARWLADGTKFDAVVGNPPFIRYQDFPETQRNVAFGLMRRLGFNPSRLSNAWLPFAAISSALVADRGRLAMVVPAELFQVNYAAELRAMLADMFARISILTFRELVFPDIQQEVVLILADRSPVKRRGIQVIELNGVDDLKRLDPADLGGPPPKPVDHASEKWTKYFLDAKEIMLLRELRARSDVPQLGKYVEIDVGIVTGHNDFFVMPAGVRNALGLAQDTCPLVGRSAALTGLTFTETDFENWSASERPAYLFRPRHPHSAEAAAYIRRGEREGVNEGYKCRIRREWYMVPSVWRPDMFFLRQADLAPRLVANNTDAYCTDTLHRGRLINGVSASSLAAGFVNSLTYAASEVVGRSYGGGVMTFEPTEVERLPIPVEGIDLLPFGELDSLVRRRVTDAALDVADQVLLKDGLGIPTRDIRRLRGIWRKLSERRRARR